MRNIIDLINESLNIDNVKNQIKAALDKNKNIGIISEKLDFHEIANAIQGAAKTYTVSVSDNNVDVAKFENALETAVKNIPSNSNPKVLIVNLVNAKPDILNLIMPVILKKTIKNKEYSDVCFVCVFSKNDELPKPVESRLKPMFTL